MYFRGPTESVRWTSTTMAARCLSIRIQDQSPANVNNHSTRPKFTRPLESLLRLSSGRRASVSQRWIHIKDEFDPDAWTKRQWEQGKTINTVNRLVWMGLPEDERFLWGRLGDFEQVKGTSPRLIEKSHARGSENNSRG